MAGLDDLKQEAAAGAAAPSGAFSEQLIRKIGYDPRHTMDDQGRRMVKKKVPQDQRSQDSSDSGGMGAGRSPIKAVADLAPKPVLPRSPIKAIADLAQTPVLARGESPKKQIILSDFDD